jgi:predicted phosphodiesterase
VCAQPTRVILNGDTTDFLMNEDPLTLETARAVNQTRAIVTAPGTSAVLHALGRVLLHGGEVVVRLGNHDIELALPEVQALIRQSLGQPPEVASRLRFERGEEPAILEVGGARILVTHGEHNDAWNQVDYAQLPGPDAKNSGAKPESFSYAPGSRLVKTLMNPLKTQFGMRFADLLKPDFQGAVLTALAVDPTAVRTVFKGSTIQLMWQLFRQMSGPAAFPSGGEADLPNGISDAVDQAGLTKEEREALINRMQAEGAHSFSTGEEGLLDKARLKLARTGLKLYARAQKRMSGDTGDRYFELEPDAEEWQEAQRLAKKFSVGAVVIGHTHAARFKHEGDVTFVNTGTWIWLMRLPKSDASEDDWADFLYLIQRNPGLDPAKGPTAPLLSRFTGALIEPAESGGANLSLFEWKADGTLVTQGSQRIAPSAG